MKKQTLMLVVAMIAISLGSFERCFAKKSLTAENYKLLHIKLGSDTALCIMVSPGSLGYTNDMTKYEDLRSKVEGKKVKVNGEKYIIECCPASYPGKFYALYEVKSDYDYFVITQLGTDFYKHPRRGGWTTICPTQESTSRLTEV